MAASKQASIVHTHFHNAVTLVCGSLRLAPIIHCCTSLPPRLSYLAFITYSDSLGIRLVSYTVCLSANLVALCITPLSGGTRAL